ncbi:BsuPI-related putative proteinase inhibitor [Aliikangiella coralliicola]|uniref:Intracellular proteinase inhibitor BsuPI domain-containing protein n=1 Tax=Aliikangiella coralliicola TaxID=2592383 RepID=A0A545UFZ1_9GAMM|nr:BsuPI-related putative proteinase inhibitor [Aliikangiella coralliicola]TQV88394.1 hypothetical protein FLL46_07685 [Aliikangiella coralliicola]
MKGIAKSLVAFVAATASFASWSNDYVPHNESDYSTFKNSYNQTTTLEVKEQYGSHWKKYSNYLGKESQWIWSSQNSQQVYWFSDSGVAELLVDFDDPVGTEYQVSIDACSDTAKLVNKRSLLSTPAGHFSDVSMLTFSGACADAGLLNAWFVPKVGLVQWQEQSIAGPVTFSLVDAKINGIQYPVMRGLQISSQMESGSFNLNKKDRVAAFIDLTNPTSNAFDLTFNSGQRFDIELYNEHGEMVNCWSDNRVFIQMMQTISLNPGETQRFGDYIELRDFSGERLDEGAYKLRIEVKGYSQNTVNAKAIMYAVEVPLFLEITTAAK